MSTKPTSRGGGDLHGDNSVVVVAIDEQDRMVLEKRIGNDLAMLVERLSRFQAWLAGVVLESTSNSTGWSTG